ncbi:MAG: MaoC family dehydratase N-terminal domain-containing protein [Candidatus Lambdaproteobacteria bacterium]|nr:MaoC family dehydratase N-terminal domain-containing protein [Candidatus Lambdaproteobacteria bacterium]
MEPLLTPEIRSAIGRSLPPLKVEVHRSDIRKYAVATGQRLRKYTDGDEAPPLLLFGLFRPVVPRERMRPDGIQEDTALIPVLPLKRIMAGGVETEYHRPIRAGDVLVATQRLVELYEKEGSSGPLIFIVTENRVETEAGDLVAVERTTRIAR